MDERQNSTKSSKKTTYRNGLTNHQKDQLRHIQSLHNYHNGSSEIRLDDDADDNDYDGNKSDETLIRSVARGENNSDDCAADEADQSSSTLDANAADERLDRKRKRAAEKSDDVAGPIQEEQGNSADAGETCSSTTTAPISLPKSVLQHRQALLQQLDLAIEIRSKMEAAVKQGPQEASELLLQPEMVACQLRLVALSEAVQGGYTLSNYDYYMKQYEDQFTSRTTTQAAVKLLGGGGKTSPNSGAS
mmetsp:Transcript_8507/g.23539  ORF Transcript_8507/g.23539 Transcript_8507/m.23539 type:complete len:247 (-) Transcript_8507:965-1705(-)